MELHTFSSLNSAFLKEYSGTMDLADTAIVYFNPEVIKHKKLEPISSDQVIESFKNKNLLLITDKEKLVSYIQNLDLKNKNLLLMSSGNFSGINLQDFAQSLMK